MHATHLPNRRQFMHTVAGTAAALSVAPMLAAETPITEIPILDAHVHIWDLKQFTLPWLKPDAPFASDFAPKLYREAIAGTPTKASMYMEVDVAPEQKQAEADYIRKLIASKSSPFVAAIVGGMVIDPGFVKYASQFKGDPIVKGIRQVLHTPDKGPKYCLQPEFIAAIKELGKLGLTFDLCVRAVDLANFVEFAAAVPDTKIVLDHCGNPDVMAKDNTPWMKQMDALAKRDNVAVKLSGILYTAPKGKWKPADLAPIVKHTYGSFGPDRTIFASDWPVCTMGGTYKQWYAAVTEILAKESTENLTKLLGGNAKKWYGVTA